MSHMGPWRKSLPSRGRTRARTLRQEHDQQGQKVAKRPAGWSRRTKGIEVGGEVSATD